MNNSVVISLSDKFSALVRAELAEHMPVIIQRNKTAPAGVCATHDFCDANEIMAEAFLDQLGHAPDGDCENDTALWNAAWDMSLQNSFQPRKTSDQP
jgi:hypothetical protein